MELWRAKLKDGFGTGTNQIVTEIQERITILQNLKLGIIEATQDVPLSEVFHEDEAVTLAKEGINTLGQLIEALRYSGGYGVSPAMTGVCIEGKNTIFHPEHYLSCNAKTVLTQLGLGFLFNRLLIREFLRPIHLS